MDPGHSTATAAPALLAMVGAKRVGVEPVLHARGDVSTWSQSGSQLAPHILLRS
jgi:hypothetical protein